MAGVEFFIDDVRNHFARVGSTAVSDTNGEARLSVSLPGCPQVEFEVSAPAPAGYRATTPERVRQRGDEPFLFGFAQKP